MKRLVDNFKNNTVIKIACAFAAFFVFYHIAAFLFPIMLAVALAFVLHPVAKLFEKIPVGPGKKRLPQAIAILLSFVAMTGFFYLIAKLIVLPLFGEVNQFLKELPEYMQKVDSTNLDWLGLDQQTRSELPSNLLSLIDSLLAWAMSYILEMMKSLVKSTFEMAILFVGLIVVPFLAFYFLKDWRELRKLFIDVFSYGAQTRVAAILDELGDVLSSYVRGMFKLSLIVGISITAGVYLLGIDYPLILGFLAMMAEFIPVVGPVVIAVPAVFLAYADSPVLALKIAVFYFVFYQMDAHYLMPRIMGKSIQLHPVLLILSLLIGAKLFGILGLLFAVPVAAVCKVLYKNLWHSNEDKKVEE
ncbi:MAG: AI-2E family transporter [Acidaminococcaceae bacterium]